MPLQEEYIVAEGKKKKYEEIFHLGEGNLMGHLLL